MNIVNRFKLIFMATFMGVALMLSPFVVFAAVNPVVQLGKNANLGNIVTEVNQVAVKNNLSWFMKEGSSNGYTTIELNMEEYNDEKTSFNARKAIMETAISEIVNNATLSSQDRTRLYNFIAKQDTGLSGTVRLLSDDVRSDVISGYYFLRPFSSTMSTILGVLAILLIIAVTMTILIDLAFLSIPALQWALMKDSNKDKPKFASLEAWKAYQEYQNNDDGLGILSIYFRKKVLQFGTLSICILYLVSGHIYDLAGRIITAFQGFLD